MGPVQSFRNGCVAGVLYNAQKLGVIFTQSGRLQKSARVFLRKRLGSLVRGLPNLLGAMTKITLDDVQDASVVRPGVDRQVFPSQSMEKALRDFRLLGPL